MRVKRDVEFELLTNLYVCFSGLEIRGMIGSLADLFRYYEKNIFCRFIFCSKMF